MITMWSQCVEESAEESEGVHGPELGWPLQGAGGHREDAGGTSFVLQDPVQVRSLPSLRQ